MGMRNIDKEIENFIKSISDLWKEEALDGDQTQEIVNKLLSELNYRNGNDLRNNDLAGNCSSYRPVSITESDLVLASEILDSVENKSKEEKEAINRILNLAFGKVFGNKEVRV